MILAFAFGVVAAEQSTTLSTDIASFFTLAYHTVDQRSYHPDLLLIGEPNLTEPIDATNVGPDLFTSAELDLFERTLNTGAEVAGN